VICQKRENADKFWFSKNWHTVLPKDRWRWFRRQYFKRIAGGPLQIPTSRVIRLLKEVYRYDGQVVHVFFGHIAVSLLPFLKACPKPIVVSFHGADVGVDVTKPAFAAALQEVFNISQLVLARSESLLHGLRALGCPPEKLRLQRTGIPLDQWKFSARPWPADGEWVLLQACRLVKKKGLLTTLAAFREFSIGHPKARLVLAGDGPLRESLEQTAREWGLADRVSFPGFLDQKALREMVAQAHIFLHPSETPENGDQEGVPNAMLEAMATGLPALATRHGGIPEAVTDGVSGYLVAEGDSAALAAKLQSLCTQEALYRQMALAARLEVEQKYERGRISAELEGFYASLVPNLPISASPAVFSNSQENPPGPPQTLKSTSLD
jgi:colanic acid/amylovoran biosynthesis glycosyltransferase